MKLKYLLPIMATSFSAVALAESNSTEQKVDPSDLTNVTTSAALIWGSEGNKKVQATAAGGTQSGMMYQGRFEATLDSDFDYTGARAQWFQVFDTGMGTMPKAGFSIDVIHNTSDNMDTLTGAIGAVAMVPSGIDGLTFFPQAAAVAGDVELTQLDKSHTVYGGMGAFYVSQRLGGNGAYIMAWPEYTNISGDGLSLETLKWSAAIGSPITKDKKWWTQLLLEYSNNTLEQSDLGIDSDTTDKAAWLFFRRYF